LQEIFHKNNKLQELIQNIHKVANQNDFIKLNSFNFLISLYAIYKIIKLIMMWFYFINELKYCIIINNPKKIYMNKNILIMQIYSLLLNLKLKNY